MKPIILCVDDDRFNLAIYKSILDMSGYDHLFAASGEEALTVLKETKCDLVIMDHFMSAMNGIESCRAIHGLPGLAHLPIIFATADSSRDVKLQAYEAGASDFITKPVDPVELVARVKNLLNAKAYQDSIQEYNQRLEEEVARKSRELRESYIETIHRLTLATEYRDEDTADHIHRISNYAQALATALGLSEKDSELIYYASPMHDVGKIGIPDNILNKPGQLAKSELEVMKTHPMIGAKILANSTSSILKCAELIARDHHERYDGSGYPHSKRGEEISVQGRVVCLVDVYDALRMKRPYKAGLSHKEAIHIMTIGDSRTSPSHFDPKMLEAFMDTHQMFDEIFTSSKECAGSFPGIGCA